METTAFYTQNLTVTSVAAILEPEMERISLVATLLLKCVTPFIVAVGTVGNLLSFIVLSRKRMRQKSVYFYLMLLACADTIVLYTNAFKAWFRTTFGWELYTYSSDAACKIHNFVQAVTLHMSAWLIVLMTVDRFVAVVFPLKAAAICTSRRAAIFSSICLGICCLYKSHLFWTYQLQELEDGSVYCGYTEYDIFTKNYYPYLNIATYSLLPFLIVLTLNCKIAVQLRVRQAAGAMVQTDSSGKRAIMRRTTSKSSDQSISKMTTVLFIVSFTWLLLSLPFTVVSLIPASIGGHNNKLIRVVCFLLLWSNHSINFFLYCMSGRKLRGMIYNQLCEKRPLRSRSSRLNNTQRTQMVTLSLRG